MKRHILLASLIVFLTSVPVFAADEGRFSGRVVEVKGNSIILEVMGPWTGPGTGLSQRTITLSPGATLRQVTPTGSWNGTTPGYDVRTLDAKALKPGDFVTVITNGSSVAALDLMHPSDAGLASPAMETR